MLSVWWHLRCCSCPARNCVCASVLQHNRFNVKHLPWNCRPVWKSNEMRGQAGIFNFRLWQCHILVSHCLYLNVLCDFFTLKASCGRVHYNRSRHLCSQLNIQWPCYCILSFYYFIFPILLWLFSFASSRFPPFHYFPFPLPRSFLIFFTLISLLPSHWSSPPLYSILRTLLIFLPLFTAQASLTQCVSAPNFGFISVHPS